MKTISRFFDGLEFMVAGAIEAWSFMLFAMGFLAVVLSPVILLLVVLRWLGLI